MISVDEAYHSIDSQTKHFGTERIPLLSALNRTLSVNVTADRDFPPFDRVTMDGIAISSGIFLKGRRKFIIEKISAAGSPVQILEKVEQCIEVMTGAVLPQNTDAVIPYEECDVADKVVVVKRDSISAFQNVHRKGTDEKKDAILLEKNTRISPAHISLMATVGMSKPEVYKLPLVAICSTGDELLPIEQTPLPHQIRQSNVYLLAADLKKENIEASSHHLPDSKEEMKRMLQGIIQHHDVILLSGAVSKGRYDFLPHVLAELSMKTIFHGVAQRPGKPFLFGTIGEKLVFGFPGNPVSTFVCYHLYCRRWLMQSLHLQASKITARLSKSITLSSSLTHHVLVKLFYKEGECIAEPISFSTSGDIPSLLHADGILTVPPDKRESHAGKVFDVILCR